MILDKKRIRGQNGLFFVQIVRSFALRYFIKASAKYNASKIELTQS